MKYLKLIASAPLYIIGFCCLAILLLLFTLAFFPAFLLSTAGGQPATEKMVAAMSATLDALLWPTVVRLLL